MIHSSIQSFIARDYDEIERMERETKKQLECISQLNCIFCLNYSHCSWAEEANLCYYEQFGNQDFINQVEIINEKSKCGKIIFLFSLIFIVQSCKIESLQNLTDKMPKIF